MSRAVTCRVSYYVQTILLLDVAQQATTPTGQAPLPVPDTEQRTPVLTYFIFRGPPSEEQKLNRTSARRLIEDKETGPADDNDGGVGPSDTPTLIPALHSQPHLNTAPDLPRFTATLGPVQDGGLVDQDDAVDCEVITSRLWKTNGGLIGRVCSALLRPVLCRQRGNLEPRLCVAVQMQWQLPHLACSRLFIQIVRSSVAQEGFPFPCMDSQPPLGGPYGTYPR